MPSLRTAAALLVGACVVTVEATLFPATVDLSLVFPRNTTYDANTLLPMVFAIENPSVIPSVFSTLQARLDFELRNGDNISSTWGGTLVQPTSNLQTNGTTYLAVSSMDPVFGKAGVWELAWTFYTANCSADGNYEENNPRRLVTFTTTTDGGAQPDVAVAAANTSCGLGNGIYSSVVVIEVDDTLNIAGVQPANWYGNFCAVQRPAASPTVPSSCAVSLDAAAVASISAAATSDACDAKTPVISCPPAASTSSSAASGLSPIKVSFSPATGNAGVALAIASVSFLVGISLYSR